MSFPRVHRVSESFPSIFVAARYLLNNHLANPGDVVIAMRGTREICRGEVSALAELAVAPGDKGAPPPWLTRYNREEKIQANR